LVVSYLRFLKPVLANLNLIEFVVKPIQSVIYVRINGLNKRGDEVFVKRFLKRLDKNEVLTTITEEVIKEANQTM